jgi:hypothetical protein
MFENKPNQNYRAHVESLMEYFRLKNVPPQLRLFTAMKSLKGLSVTTWSSAVSQTFKHFEEFKLRFLQKYWDVTYQSRVRVSIYQDRLQRDENVSYAHHFMQYLVKVKYLYHPIPEAEFLEAMKHHFPLSVQRAW